MDRTTITDFEWSQMFDTALDEGSVAEMYVIEEFVCADGSGGFTITFHNRFDFATFQFFGRQDVGSWEITAGSGEYADLSGSGDVTLDWDRSQVEFSGDLGSR